MIDNITKFIENYGRVLGLFMFIISIYYNFEMIIFMLKLLLCYFLFFYICVWLPRQISDYNKAKLGQFIKKYAYWIVRLRTTEYLDVLNIVRIYAYILFIYENYLVKSGYFYCYDISGKVKLPNIKLMILLRLIHYELLIMPMAYIYIYTEFLKGLYILKDKSIKELIVSYANSFAFNVSLMCLIGYPRIDFFIIYILILFNIGGFIQCYKRWKQATNLKLSTRHKIIEMFSGFYYKNGIMSNYIENVGLLLNVVHDVSKLRVSQVYLFDILSDVKFYSHALFYANIHKYIVDFHRAFIIMKTLANRSQLLEFQTYIIYMLVIYCGSDSMYSLADVKRHIDNHEMYNLPTEWGYGLLNDYLDRKECRFALQLVSDIVYNLEKHNVCWKEACNFIKNECYLEDIIGEEYISAVYNIEKSFVLWNKFSQMGLGELIKKDNKIYFKFYETAFLKLIEDKDV